MQSSTLSVPDFSAILASSIHDMKISLSTIRDLISQLNQSNADNAQLMQLEFEANRMNNSLMQLLALYRIEIERFSLQIDEHSSLEILQDIKAQQSSLLALNDIHLELENTKDFSCYCDADLIGNAISSILNNAQRYSLHKIILSTGKTADSFTYFSIEDDGPGFPDILLNTKMIDFNTGNTGLGLYFVAIIANLHRHDGKSGYITTDNDSRLGGGKFTLYLP